MANNAFEESILEKKWLDPLPYTTQNTVSDLNVKVKTIRVSNNNTGHNGKGNFI